MSELMNAEVIRSDFRRHLLVTTSVLVLIGGVAAPYSAFATDDQDKPTVWIELGGQLERMDDGEVPYAPPFVTANSSSAYNIVSPLSAERSSRYSFGGEGKITFEPEGTDWVFSAGIRYGRSNRGRHVHQQTSTKKREYFLYVSSVFLSNLGYPKQYVTSTRFNDVQVKRKESHTILDFMAGKDVGLGLFGHSGTSTISAGVRYAQFSAKSTAVFHSLPSMYLAPVAYPSAYHESTRAHHSSFYARADVSRNFHGFGPSISWTGSTPVAGRPEAGSLAIDWGINAAVLFGRQKVRGTHMTTGRYFSGDLVVNAGTPTQHYVRTVPINRAHSVVVPNLGGFAGVSFNFPNAKASFGYRADFFFGAMDGGIDTRKTYDRDFYGPFATVSIGLGG
jgi:hypothetical protein